MNPDNLEFDPNVQGLPFQHPEQTGLCYSIPKLMQAVERGLEGEGLDHLRNCAFCQKTLRMAFGAACPHFDVLTSFAEKPSFAGGPAVKEHVRGCRRCELALRAIRGGIQFTGCIGSGYLHLAGNRTQEEQQPDEGTLASHEDVSITLTPVDGALMCSLRLPFHVAGAGPWILRLVGERGQKEIAVQLRRGPDGFTANLNLGPLHSLIEAIGPGVLAVLAGTPKPLRPRLTFAGYFARACVALLLSFGLWQFHEHRRATRTLSEGRIDGPPGGVPAARSQGLRISPAPELAPKFRLTPRTVTLSPGQKKRATSIPKPSTGNPLRLELTLHEDAEGAFFRVQLFEGSAAEPLFSSRERAYGKWIELKVDTSKLRTGIDYQVLAQQEARPMGFRHLYTLRLH